MCPTKKKIEIGSYQYDPDNEEWDIRLDKESYFSTKSQTEAELLSRLVRIERLLNKIVGRGKSEIQAK